MKVSPLHDLIVCVLPSQSIVRHIVLAAAAHVLVLCGAASAQSVPAAPPLFISPAVEITHGTALKSTVTLEHSGDLQLWQAAGVPVFGGGGEWTRFIATGPEAQGFFRLKTETRPDTGLSRWDLAGSRLLLTDGPSAKILTFSDGDSGLAVTAEAHTAFTWQWMRDGRDTGRVTLAWPDGLTETVELTFTAANAGAFTATRSRDGLPAGVAAGVFRDETARGLDATAPSSPGNAVLVLSNTGRPLRITLSEAGTAHVSNPSGEREFTVSYSLTGQTSATVMLSCQDGDVEFYSLQFTGPACGRYEMNSRRDGKLRRAGSGSFTIAPR